MKIDETVRSQLLAMSAATIDRHLRSIREHALRRSQEETAALNRVRKLVPVRTSQIGESQVRIFEMDMVVHCGERAEGTFVHSLVLTDICFAAPSCAPLSVPFEASVASVIARPAGSSPGQSAIGHLKQPYTFRDIGSRLGQGGRIGCKAIHQRKPAESSAPDLILDPDDNCCRTVCRLLLVLLRLFSA